MKDTFHNVMPENIVASNYSEGFVTKIREFRNKVLPVIGSGKIGYANTTITHYFHGT